MLSSCFSFFSMSCAALFCLFHVMVIFCAFLFVFLVCFVLCVFNAFVGYALVNVFALINEENS